MRASSLPDVCTILYNQCQKLRVAVETWQEIQSTSLVNRNHGMSARRSHNSFHQVNQRPPPANFLESEFCSGYHTCVETYYCESSVWNPPVFGKLFLMFDLYRGNTGCLEMEQTSTSYIL